MQRWHNFILPCSLFTYTASIFDCENWRKKMPSQQWLSQAWWGAKLVLDRAVILWNKIISLNSLLEVTSFYNQRADCLSECIGCYTVWVSRVIFLSEENLGPYTWRAIWRHSKITFAQNFRLLTPYMLH